MSMKGGNMGYAGKVKCIRESNSIFMKEGEIYEIVDGYFYREGCHKNIFPIESIEYFNAEYKTQIEEVKAASSPRKNKRKRTIGELPVGTKIEILDETGGWGYVEKGDIGVVAKCNYVTAYTPINFERDPEWRINSSAKEGKYFNVIEEVDFNLDEYIEEKIEDVKAKEQQKPNKKSKEVNKMNRYKYINCEVGEDGEGEPSILYI